MKSYKQISKTSLNLLKGSLQNFSAPVNPVFTVQSPATQRFFFKSFKKNTTEKIQTDPITEPLTKEPQTEKSKREALKTEIQELYQLNHIPLAQSRVRKYGAPYTDTSVLDKDLYVHHEPTDMTDKVALGVMRFLKVLVHLFFRDKYTHHAVVLETVAACPGLIAGANRHFKSLRQMKRDYGRIGNLLEEAENERMHLLTWMDVCQPTFLERMLVIAAQFTFSTGYTVLYALHPRFSHRLVGYLEEEAYEQYTLMLNAIDDGRIKNIDAPEIAKKYWNLKPEAKLRDVVLVIRSDEAAHRDFNHDISDKEKYGMH